MIEVLEPRRVLSSANAFPNEYGGYHDSQLSGNVIQDLNGSSEQDTGFDDSPGNYGDTTLTAAVADGPTNGTLTLNSDGSFVYTPDTGFIGSDTFTYTVSIGGVTSAPATVTLNLSNSPPELTSATSFSFSDTLENGAAVETVTAYDVDIDTVTYSLADPSGIFAIDANTGVITIVNADNIVGEEQYILTVTMSDGFVTADAEVTAIALGDWKIRSPDEGATLSKDNNVMVKVQHPKAWAWGFKVQLYKGNVEVATKEKGADSGFYEEFDFGKLAPGTYTLKYSSKGSNGDYTERDSRSFTVE